MTSDNASTHHSIKKAVMLGKNYGSFKIQERPTLLFVSYLTNKETRKKIIKRNSKNYIYKYCEIDMG